MLTAQTRAEEFLHLDATNEAANTGDMEEVMQNDSDTFFLNNLLMSVQFFENYDRDIEHLRQNWYKEFSIEPHNKKCFYADSLFRLVGRYVKFSPRHGVDKNLVFELHPFRIYISCDNVEAAYDPSALKSHEHGIEPQYQFTVKPADESEKPGCIILVEHRRREPANKSRRPCTLPNINGINGAVNSDKTIQQNSSSEYQQKKYNFDEQQSRRLTKTENLMGLHNREMNPKISGRKSSLRFFPSAEGTIPVNGFYKFTDQQSRPTIRDFRMNSALTISHEIPMKCFQIEVKKKINSRRVALQECFGGQKILNAAAFKGYFCDLLLEKLSESLNLDSRNVNESIISDEFIIVNQSGTQFYVAPIITIRDWNNFVVMNKKFRFVGKTEQVVWPSNFMQKIINLLPCNAVPNAYSQREENLRNQKVWSLVFPKAEEFLLLHMMHAHIRCYLFVLLLYKSFIEKEINAESFGPKHLMHLLFWRVHKNFFAWPEDRPAETLLNFLKILYKKLQNKSLCDFFITSRNLFACSRTKDLHKAQALIKKIIENPVLYISRAIRNLKLEADYYPAFDVVKLFTALKLLNTPVTSKRMRKEKKEKRIHFQEDPELLWKKIAIKRIEVEKKLQEQEQLSRLSAESIEAQEMSVFKSQDLRKCNQILEIFTSHFIQMGIKSLEYNVIRQALFYLSQTEKVFELMMNNEMDKDNLNPTIKRINELKVTCYDKLKKDFPKFSSKQYQATSEKLFKNLEDFQVEDERVPKNSISRQLNQQEKETINSDEKDFNLDEDNKIVTVKL